MYKIARRSVAGLLARGVGCLAFACLCVAFPAEAAGGIREGLGLCYRAIIPSLFPFLFACSYLFSLLSHCRIVPVKLLACTVFSLVGGFPMGARSLHRLVDDGTLTPKQASLALSGAVNAGPAFLIASVGSAMFGSPHLGVCLFVSLSLSSLLCGALFLCLGSRKKGVRPGKNGKEHGPVPAVPSPVEFTICLEGAVGATLSMCGYVCFFSCVLALIGRLVSLSPLAAFGVASLCEVSGGCAKAAAIGGSVGARLACASVSLCGVSVLMQVRSGLSQSGISMRYLFLSRPLHLAVSLLLLNLMLSGNAAETAYAAARTAAALFSINPIFSFFFLLTGLVFTLCSKRLSASPRTSSSLGPR